MIVEVRVSELRHPVQTVVRAVIHAVRTAQLQVYLNVINIVKITI